MPRPRLRSMLPWPRVAACGLACAAVVAMTLGVSAQTVPVPDAAPGAPPVVVAEAPPRNTLIVFDGSGSMWGKIEGENRLPKFALVREALRKSLAAPPAGARLGMLSFGYRRQGDCSDVGVLTQLDALTADNMVERVVTPLEKINPKGKGPITAAVREAARMIGKTAGPRSLVVVHDGPDNCGMNLCDAVTEFKEAAPGVVIHVLGLALDEDDAKTYQCLATATGGTHYDIRSAADIPPAIEAATRLALGTASPFPTAAQPASAAATSAQPVPPPPKPVDLAKDGPPHFRLRALMSADKPFPVDQPLRWTIRPETGKAAAPVAVGQDALVPASTGRYVIAVEDGFARAERTVAAPEKGHQLVELPLDAGFVRFAAAVESGTVLTIYDRGAPPATPQSAAPGIVPGRVVGILSAVPARLTLPAGNYLLRTERGNRRYETPVTLAAAETKSLPSTDHAVVEVALGQRIAADGKDRQTARPVVLTVEEDDPLSPRGRREVARSSASPAVFTLSPGSYTLVAAQGPLEVRERIAVTAGERVRRTLALAASRMLIAMRGPGGGVLGADGQRVWYRIERRDTTGAEPLYAFDADTVVDVPPGRYRITGHAGASIVPAVAEVDMAAGETRAVVLTPAAGALVLRPGAKLTGDVAWQITDDGGRRVWLTGAGAQQLMLAPGRYAVRATGRDHEAEVRVELKLGERREATVGD